MLPRERMQGAPIHPPRPGVMRECASFSAAFPVTKPRSWLKPPPANFCIAGKRITLEKRPHPSRRPKPGSGNAAGKTSRHRRAQIKTPALIAPGQVSSDRAKGGQKPPSPGTLVIERGTNFYRGKPDKPAKAAKSRHENERLTELRRPYGCRSGGTGGASCISVTVTRRLAAT
jgi:hypothetical protein